MNHEKFWNGSIIKLPQPSLSQPKGAPWFKRARPPLSLTGGAHLSSPSSRRARRRARALAPPPPRIPPHPAFPARLKEGENHPRDSLSRFPLFSLSLSLGFVRIAPAILADVINGARELRGRFPSSPAALSPSRRYKIVPRASLFRFRRSPLALAVGFVPAPCSSLSAVAAELRFAAVVAPVLLPTRRHLRPLRRVAADPVRRSASPVDCRSAVALGIPTRAAVFLRSGRRSRRRRCPGVSRGPPFAFPLPSSLSGAAPPRRWSPAVTIGARARRSRRPRRRGRPRACPRGCQVGPAVSRPRPRVRLTRGTHGADRRQPRAPDAAASEDPLFVEVEAVDWESEQGKSHHP
uniref:Zinc knuckle domain-like n=1 Tax=Oryza nivara TaxID=4536 RepID=A0A679BA88_ORYNI|nr:zinc knuckle domain-like [Oryza sativa f. spontanea]